MRARPRPPFVVTFAASALAACGSTPEPTPTPVVPTGPPPTVDMPVGNPPVLPPIVEPPRNPPPIPTTVCPVEPPAAGQICSADLSCHYGSTDPCDPTFADFRCVNGVFATTPRPTCNPPPPSVTPSPAASS